MEANTDTSTSRNICALRVAECVHMGAELHTNICGSMKVFTEMVKPYREEHKDTQAYVFFHTHPPLHPWGSSSHRQECLPTHKCSLKTKCQQVHSGTCKTHTGVSGHKYTQVCQPTLRSADMEWHTHTHAHTHPCRPYQAHHATNTGTCLPHLQTYTCPCTCLQINTQGLCSHSSECSPRVAPEFQGCPDSQHRHSPCGILRALAFPQKVAPGTLQHPTGK